MRFTRRALSLPLALAILAAVACGGSDLLLPGASRPAALAIVQGNHQSARVGEPLAEPIAVRVSDAGGRPVAQTRVTFAATSGAGATITPGSVVTDNDGRASADWSLGSAAGPYTAEARVDGSEVEPARFTAFAAAGVPARVVLVKGDGQMAPAGTPLPDSLVVRATDAAGNPVEGVGVSWSATGGGSVSDAATATAADGSAGVLRTLGPAAGAQTTLAAIPGIAGSPVTFAATATSGSAGKLRVTVQPSASAELGIPFARQPRVQLLDNLDNPVPQAGRAVTVAIGTGPAGAALSGQRTRETDATGLAAFTDLAIGGPAGTYTLRFSGADLALVTSASIAATSGDVNASRSRVDAEPETFAVAGGTSTVTVTALDDLGNPVPNAAIVPTVDRTGDGTFQPGSGTSDENGRAAFTLVARKAGRYIVGARADGITLVAKDSVTATRIASTIGITSNHSQPTQVLAPVTVAWTVGSAQPARLTGSVTVSENGEARCGGPLSGQCSFTPSIVGTRTVAAAYSGDDAHEPSSDSRLLTVQPIPTQVVSLTSNRNPATTKDQVTLEARVSAAAGTPGAGTPQGSVTFAMGLCGFPGQTLGSSGLSGGVARLTRKLESVGSFCITAAYAGSAIHAPSQSPPPGLLQVVVLRR
jgi:Bacterial Ig-like domain (group 1)/Bacterial Ig-like domain (group 3)